MVLFSRISVGFGAFLIVTGVVYGGRAYEWEGFTLMLIVAGGAFLVGAWLVSAVRRARATLAESPGEARADGADAEPHVGPTIWPLVLALATVGLVVGAVATRWVLVGGSVLFVVASVGWVIDVRRQWQPHAEANPHETSRPAAPEPHAE